MIYISRHYALLNMNGYAPNLISYYLSEYTFYINAY